MSIISWFFWAVMFLVMLGFALSNTTTATLRFFGSNLEWSAPIVVHLLVFFISGVAFGLLAVVPAWYKGRRNISKLEREVRQAKSEVKAPPIAPTVDVPRPPMV
jgi:lipopolysaccharide assembly protein A